MHPLTVLTVTAWRSCAGVAMYLAGEVLFRHVLRLGSLLGRFTVATLAVATALIGLAVGYIARLTLLVVLLTGLLTVELRTTRRTP